MRLVLPTPSHQPLTCIQNEGAMAPADSHHVHVCAQASTQCTWQQFIRAPTQTPPLQEPFRAPRRLKRPPQNACAARGRPCRTTKKGCCSACAAVGLLAGSQWHRMVIRSMASGDPEGTIFDIGMGEYCSTGRGGGEGRSGREDTNRWEK